MKNFIDFAIANMRSCNTMMWELNHAKKWQDAKQWGERLIGYTHCMTDALNMSIETNKERSHEEAFYECCINHFELGIYEILLEAARKLDAPQKEIVELEKKVIDMFRFIYE